MRNPASTSHCKAETLREKVARCSMKKLVSANVLVSYKESLIRQSLRRRQSHTLTTQIKWISESFKSSSSCCCPQHPLCDLTLTHVYFLYPILRTKLHSTERSNVNHITRHVHAQNQAYPTAYRCQAAKQRALGTIQPLHVPTDKKIPSITP